MTGFVLWLHCDVNPVRYILPIRKPKHCSVREVGLPLLKQLPWPQGGFLWSHKCVPPMSKPALKLWLLRIFISRSVTMGNHSPSSAQLGASPQLSSEEIRRTYSSDPKMNHVFSVYFKSGRTVSQLWSRTLASVPVSV